MHFQLDDLAYDFVSAAKNAVANSPFFLLVCFRIPLPILAINERRQLLGKLLTVEDGVFPHAEVVPLGNSCVYPPPCRERVT